MHKSAEELNASLDRKNNVNPRSSLRRDSQYGPAPQFKVELTDLQKPTAKPTSPVSSDEPSPDRASPTSEEPHDNNTIPPLPEQDDNGFDNNATPLQPEKDDDDKGKEEADQRVASPSQTHAENHEAPKPAASRSLPGFCFNYTAAPLDPNNLSAAKIIRLKQTLSSNTRVPKIENNHLRGFTRDAEKHSRMRDGMNKQYLEALKHLVVCSKKGDKKAEAVLTELKLMFEDIQAEQLVEAESFSTKELLEFDLDKLWREEKLLKTTNKANKFCKIQESIECNEVFLRDKLLVIIDGLKKLAASGDKNATTKLSQFMASFRANEVARLKTLEANKLKGYENFYNIPKVCAKFVEKFTYEDDLLQEAIYAYIQDATICRLSPFFRQIFALTMIYNYADKNILKEPKFGPLITGEPTVVTNLKSKFATAAKTDFNEHNVWAFMISIKKDLKEALSTYIGYRKNYTVKTFAQHTAVNEQLIKDIEMLIAWITSTDVRFEAEIDSEDADLLVLSPQSSTKKEKSTQQPMSPASPWSDLLGTSPEKPSPMTPASPWTDFDGGLEEETPLSPWLDFTDGLEEEKKESPKMIPVPVPAMQPVSEGDSSSDDDEAQDNDNDEEHSDDSSLSM